MTNRQPVLAQPGRESEKARRDERRLRMMNQGLQTQLNDRGKWVRQGVKGLIPCARQISASIGQFPLWRHPTSPRPLQSGGGFSSSSTEISFPYRVTCRRPDRGTISWTTIGFSAMSHSYSLFVSRTSAVISSACFGQSSTCSASDSVSRTCGLSCLMGWLTLRCDGRCVLDDASTQSHRAWEWDSSARQVLLPCPLRNCLCDNSLLARWL